MPPFKPTVPPHEVMQHWSDTNLQTLLDNSGSLLVFIGLFVLILVIFIWLADEQMRKVMCWMFILGTVCVLLMTLLGGPEVLFHGIVR